mmetsp:Transcript_13949/g.24666  ORF Transcript_13949/g.24666 Transcript_13949/m.24666 type:complete len:204 (-) Transcript_13949:46-657(-)
MDPCQHTTVLQLTYEMCSSALPCHVSTQPGNLGQSLSSLSLMLNNSLSVLNALRGPVLYPVKTAQPYPRTRSLHGRCLKLQPCLTQALNPHHPDRASGGEHPALEAACRIQFLRLQRHREGALQQHPGGVVVAGVVLAANLAEQLSAAVFGLADHPQVPVPLHLQISARALAHLWNHQLQDRLQEGEPNHGFRYSHCCRGSDC